MYRIEHKEDQYNPISSSMVTIGRVKCFNRTVVQKLIVYVSENQIDWNMHFSYIMMRYRVSVNETTGFTPNYPDTPLDIIYEMHMRKEITHSLVRGKKRTAMARQERYQGQKFKVHVYFPKSKTECSSKSTSYWHKPGEVMEKYTTFCYRLICCFLV